MTAVPAHALAQLSEAVYEPWPTVEARLKKHGYTLDARWDHRGSQGMLVYGPGWAAIVFRGTEASGLKLRDIFSNLTWLWPIPWQGRGRVHSGYLRHFNMIGFTAMSYAERVPTATPLYVTGHSLGGALATLFASWYHVERPQWMLAGLVTFGAPKAMNQEAAGAIRTLIARYVIPMDFASLWPPVLGLTHPAPEIRLRAPGWWPGPVSRHGVGGYVRALGD